MRKKRRMITVIGSLNRIPAAAEARTTGMLTERGTLVVNVHGTDGKVEIEDIDAAENLIACSGIMLLLLNVGVGVIVHATELAKKHHIKVVLDPAPMMDLPEKIRRLDRRHIHLLRRTRKRRSTGRKRAGVK